MFGLFLLLLLHGEFTVFVVTLLHSSVVSGPFRFLGLHVPRDRTRVGHRVTSDDPWMGGNSHPQSGFSHVSGCLYSSLDS